MILAIDPGTKRSAWVLYAPLDRLVVDSGIEENEYLLDSIRLAPPEQTCVIEKIESYGMAVGAEVFETVFWTGRFAQAADEARCEVVRLPRRSVKLHLCGSPRAKDANVRQALIDKFGGKAEAIGTKAAPGPLYGIKADLWAALAVAVTYAEAGA